MIKTFVLDTNVLLHSPNALDAFEENNVVLPLAVIEELDKFKTRSDELGRNARHVVRCLDTLRKKGNLRDGVPMENEGTLRIVLDKIIPPAPGLDVSYADNHIIGVAHHLHEAGENVIFVSKDINVRLKADALGLQVQDFENQKVSFDDLYSGFRTLHVPTAQVDEFYHGDGVVIEDETLHPNEFVLLQDSTNEKHTALGRCSEKSMVLPLGRWSEHVYNLKPRNKEQRMALELLLDPKVQLVTLTGQAGSGKTLLALAAAMESVIKQNLYDRILVTRPIIPMGKDIGYLPGDKDKKMHHWMQPIFDNLIYLVRDGDTEDTTSANALIADLMEDDLLEMEALTYIRGRSIPKQYVIIDEAQNLTPHEVKTIISRAGDETKMVLTGDPEQIDNPYLDAESNGLTYVVERMKDIALAGHITLRKSERSKLAGLAAGVL